MASGALNVAPESRYLSRTRASSRGLSCITLPRPTDIEAAIPVQHWRGLGLHAAIPGRRMPSSRRPRHRRACSVPPWRPC